MSGINDQMVNITPFDILFPTASCHDGSGIIIVGKQCKYQQIPLRNSVYNSLVNLTRKLATLSIAGNSLELFLRSLLGNQKCQSRVTTSPTVTTKEIGQSAGTCLRALMKNACRFSVTSIRQPLRDYQAMGPRKLVISDEGLRYSPALCESMGEKTGEVLLTATNFSNFTCKHPKQKQTFRKPQRMYFSKSEWNSVAGCFSQSRCNNSRLSSRNLNICLPFIWEW